MPDFVTISEAFGLGRSQWELDFVDVPVNADLNVYLDPYAISRAKGPWFAECHRLLSVFFQRLLDLVRQGDEGAARTLMGHLREPNETHLGLSKGPPRGAGVGPGQALDIYEAIASSGATRTGFIQQIAECELFIPSVGPDKISDLTTNIIRSQLIEYTKRQCELHGIPTQQVALSGPSFDADELEWASEFGECPVQNGSPILFVPKIAVRRNPAFDHEQYHRHYVLNYLMAEINAPGTSLAVALRKPVRGRGTTKKDLAERYPADKEWMLEWSRENEEVLDYYRRDRETAVDETPFDHLSEEGLAQAIAQRLIDGLGATPPGRDDSTAYEKLMAGILEFIFYPMLIYPRREYEINQGRKRIDIFFDNAARSGIFGRLVTHWKLPAATIVFECKNYANEVKNEEWDQLLGRFDAQRGEVGFLCCRTLEDRPTAIARCRDAWGSGRGLLLPLEDAKIAELLLTIRNGERDPGIDRIVSGLVSEVTS